MASSQICTKEDKEKGASVVTSKSVTMILEPLNEIKESLQPTRPPISFLKVMVRLGPIEQHYYDLWLWVQATEAKDNMRLQSFMRHCGIAASLTADALKPFVSVSMSTKFDAFEMWLRDREGTAGFLSGKMKAIHGLLTMGIPQNERVVIFSTWDNALTLVEDMLTAKSCMRPRTMITTKDVSEMKARKLQQWRQQVGGVLLISVAAGAVGITLTEARYMIFTDQLNEIMTKQIRNRMWRSSTDGTMAKQIREIHLVVSGTKEEEMVAANEKAFDDDQIRRTH